VYNCEAFSRTSKGPFLLSTSPFIATTRAIPLK
jgi:hypothetical protein